MRPLHVCYVEAGYPHAHGGGGAGTYVRLVGRELVRRGVRVSVVASWCPQCPAFTRDDGIAVYRPPGRGNLHWYLGKVPGLGGAGPSVRYLEGGWRWYRLLEGLHRRERLGVVEFTEGGDFWHACRPSFPVIAHLHGSRYTFLAQSGRRPGQADWAHRKLELSFIRRARCVLSPSQGLLDLVCREMNGRMPPPLVLPYPVDPALLQDGDAGEGQAPSRTVLLAARDDPVKGVPVLLAAVPRVRRLVPDATFLVVGPQPPAGAGPPDGVRFVRFLPRDELRAYYRRSAVCIVPSLWDNSPNTVYEAMAAGRAVVASRVGGIPELVRDGETGLLVPPGDPGRLAEAIARLLLDSGLRLAMGRAGRRRIVELAALERNVTERLALYERVAAGRSPAVGHGRRPDPHAVRRQTGELAGCVPGAGTTAAGPPAPAGGLPPCT